MERTLIQDTPQKISSNISVSGWVHSRRDHGGLLFIDLRDHTGILQLVIDEKSEAFALASSLRSEFVIRANGLLSNRDSGLTNDNMLTGKIELLVSDITILNRSETPPIQAFSDIQANEELRLKYRYLDLRRPKMQDMLKKRARYYKIIRDYMEEKDFVEVTTPIIANSSPEGARDFLLPSRLHEGKFYALPQAPQQFKQLLMVGGVPRYYQIAACFRDEDPRSDRLYGEFYQLDLEMSFVDDGEEVRVCMEPLIKNLVTDFAGKKLFSDTIPRISYIDAIENYGSDKPDLRFDMKLIDLTSVFLNSKFSVFANSPNDEKVVKAICVKNGSSLSRKQIDYFTSIAKSEGAGGLAYLIYENGNVKSPISKFLSSTELKEIKEKTGASDGDTVFFGADRRDQVNKVLGRLRNEFASHFKLKNPEIVALAWIVDFPFYEWNETTKSIDFGHNPFSMPRGGLETLDNETDKLKIVADQYDMIMNGYEVCSGGVRNHDPQVLYKVFATLGHDKSYVDNRFGAMINAFKFGAPPHAGCAFGLDRILMELLGEINVREVVAFPKNGSGVDLMMNSPSSVDPNQLKELGI